MPITLDGTLGITTPALTVTGATVNTGGISTAGNLTFTSTGQRIIGDMSNATVASRLLFQNSVTNTASPLGIIPNGTSTSSSFDVFNNSDPTNAARFRFIATSSENQIQATITGTGTYLPMTFYTGGSERMRIDTSGNVGIGTATIKTKFQVTGKTGYGNVFIVNSDYAEGSAGTGLSINTGASTGNTYVGIDSFNTGYAVGGILSLNPSGGNVGIGITAPGTILDVNGSPRFRGTINAYTTTSDRYSIIPQTAGSGVICATVDNGFTVYTPNTNDASYFVWRPSGTERMRIDSNGLVGIGTSSPTQPLTVTGNATFSASINSANTFGFKNRLINGGMNLWQRGTSVTAGSTVTWLADRWSGCQFASQTMSQSSSVPTGFQYSLKAQRPNGGTGTGLINIAQSVEYQNMYDLAGQTVTFSFWALAGANFSASGSLLGVQIQTGTTADQGTSYPYYSWTGVTQPINTTQAITTTWTKYTFTGTIPSNAKELIVVLYYTPVGTAGADDAFYTTGLQLELGSQATSFDMRSIGTETNLCLRYYYQPGYALSPTITTDSGGRSLIAFPMPVFMRTTPSFSLVRFNTRGADGFIYYPTGNTTNTTSLTCIFAGITTDGSPAQSVSQFYNMPGSVSGYIIFGQDSTLKFSAEL